MSDELSRKLNYQFKNPDLLKMSLTHRSHDVKNNERLEFLGDAIVNFIVAEILYERFPRAQEGDLSRYRASLINRDTLGILGKQFDLGRYLQLGAGELKSGGSDRLSIVSCAMEAVIGAIYLDGGFDIVRQCLMQWYEPLIQSLSDAKLHKDPKTQLQEFLQSHHRSLPSYQVESVEGEAHQQIFVVSCHVDGIKQSVIGKGSSRRRAEQDAATLMLELLKNDKKAKR